MEAIAIGAAANISSEAAKGIFHSVKRHIRYVTVYKKYVNKFEEKLKTLIAKRASVQQDVEVAERNGEKIKADVLEWRNRVDEVITEEEEKVKALEGKAAVKCFFGLCPNIMSRYQLSKKAKEDATGFDELIKECQFERVGYRDVPPLIVHTDFETFKSREKVFNDIMDSLKDSTMSMIGVYGMPGVGKTSLLKEVSRQVQEAKLFDSVVMVFVSQNPDIQKIQDQLAESLGLNLEEKSTVVRSRRLCERLMNEKKVLIVLDDIWKKLDLEEVGIPFGSQHKGCKILLASRNQNVLSNEMDATKTFAVGDLDDTEAWEFFKKMAGDGVESSELRPTAIEVANKCARLPLALATVAKALRNKSLFAWKDALRQLQRPSPKNFTEMPAEVYSAIELSFNHLPSEDLKQIFLLCSLLRPVARIDDLLRYAVGLGLINEINTMEEARNRLLKLVSDLKDSCLLLDSNSTNEQYLAVHDLIYIVAMSIISRDNHVFCLKQGDALTNWPDRDTMRQCKKMFLHGISKLPVELNCPQLSLFLMSRKDLSLTLPDNFFKEATALKVLNLTKMHFSSLPSSISLLTSLCTLCLDQCKLGDITIIGGLQSLEILSLLGSDIEVLPEEIGQLVRLKLLDLSRCSKLKIIPPGVLSNLSRLEELYMGHSFTQWEVDRPANQRSNTSLADLKTLSSLSTLEVHIPDAKAVPEDLFFQVLQKLERYKIFIGKGWEWFGNYQYSRTLKLRLSAGIDDLVWGIKMLLKKTEDLYLDELESFKNIELLELNEGISLLELKNLHIQNGLDIEYIINDDDAAEKIEFVQLKSLTLQCLPQLISYCPQHKNRAASTPQHELPLFSEKIWFPCLENLQLSSINVERIWHNQPSSFCTYEKLKTLKIEDCRNLKHLFSFSMAKCLVHLRDFEITGCNSLREIIFREDIQEEIQATTITLLLFPQLKSLKLRDLQHLIGFCSNSDTQVIKFSSMKLLTIDNCPGLECFIHRSTTEGNQSICSQVLFDNKVAFPSLEKMSLSFLRKMKMIWQDPVPANFFPKLKHLVVEGCNELLAIFPSNMLATFRGLQTLALCSCASLEYVFEAEKKETPVSITTQLWLLHIGEMPNLKKIWRNDPQGIFTFKNLSEIRIFRCWDLKNVFPASVARDLPQLRKLQILDCMLEEIVSKLEEGSETVVTFEFRQLSHLRFWHVGNLKCFYPGEHTTRWPMLNKLKVGICGKMKILGTEHRRLHSPDMSQNEQHDSPIHPPLFLVEKIVPKLHHLSLHTDDIAMISDCGFSSSLFREIKVLRVFNESGESVNFQVSFLERFYHLEKLVLISVVLRELLCIEGGTSNEETYAGTLSTVKIMKLAALSNVKNYLWNQDVRVDRILPNLETLKVYTCKNLISLGSSSAQFRNLTTLDVWYCKGMKYLDTSLGAQGLVQLKKLTIRDCISMEEIITGNEGDERACNIIFSRLKSLELVNLPQLKSFSSGNHAFGFPCLEEVIVNCCPELEIFCKGALNTPSLQRVQYEKDKGHWDGDLNSTIQQLYSKKVEYRGMSHIVLSEFSRSIEIWKENIQGSLDFKQLRYLEVYECNSLKYIFTISMAVDLVQLEEIKVKNCPMMEQIIRNEGAEEVAVDAIFFPRLSIITLDECSNLKSFCVGSITLHCPSLKTIEVNDCPKMHVMTSTVSPRQPEDMDIIGGEENTPFFNDKVLCANLVYLVLSSTNIQKIWPDEPHIAITCNVQNLEFLFVEGCHNLEFLFPSFLIKNLDQLQQLFLYNCENMEQIIFTEGRITQTFLFPKLQKLELRKLPKLERFCWGDNSDIDAQALFNEKVAFPSLEDLKTVSIVNCRKIWLHKVAMDSFYELKSLLVEDCQSFLNVFPSTMVERLGKLENLFIWECESLEEIIGHDDQRLNSNESHAVTATELIEAKSTNKFVFPKLAVLGLKMLPNLKVFYSKMHTTEWPSLKQLYMVKCNKVETFAGECRNFRETQGESQLKISIQQPLFWVNEVTFPNLEELILAQNGVMKWIWHGKLPNHCFCKLRDFKFISFPETTVTIPNCFLQSLPNLEDLDVRKAAINELFPCEGLRDEAEHAGTLARLKQLTLLELPELTHLWKKEVSLAEVLCNLEVLKVFECISLKNLVPSFVPFRNLIILEVSECHGLRNLVRFTVAKSMVQLAAMRIHDCKMIEEIIASTTDEVVDGISFEQLKSLELDSLPCLSRFCSGDSTLVFPALEQVILRQCPKMEFFSKGDLSTPMLQGLQSINGEDVELWEGDLNAIIQHLFIAFSE